MSLRVFLVEDLQSMRTLITDLFESIGGLQVVAMVGTEAEAKLWLVDNPGAWDIAIIDLVLAEGSGFGVISHCRSASAAGKVVVFSSYATPGIEMHCADLGADAVFDKKNTAAFVTWMHAQTGGAAPAS